MAAVLSSPATNPGTGLAGVPSLLWLPASADCAMRCCSGECTRA